MKKPVRHFLLGALVVAVISYVIWHLATNYAYKNIWVDLGPVPEARNNPYFAAQKFLENKGYKVKSTGLLAEVTGRLENTDTLFLFYDHELEYQTLSTDIHDWVKRGGHLVLTVHYLWDEDSKASGDPYLDDLGVRQYLWPREAETTDTETTDAEPSGTEPSDAEPSDTESSDDNAADDTEEMNDAGDADESAESGDTNEEGMPTVGDSDDEESDAEATGDDDDDANPLHNLNIPVEGEETSTCGMSYAETVSLLPLSQGSHPLRIAFESEYHVEDISGHAHAPFTEPPAHMLQYTLGAGKITVLTDHFIFDDGNIGDYDHAFFLWSLADTSPHVWLVYDKDSDTLITLLWTSAPYLCLSVIALLAGWLVFRGGRFGPILSAENVHRRQLQEHIDASTSFIWRAEEQSMLIEEARQPVLNKCPVVGHQITPTPRLQRAMEQLGLSDERLLWALTTPTVADEAEFIELIRLLQQLRTTL